MTVLRNSLLGHWLLALLAGFSRLWEGSALGGWCRRRAADLAAWAQNSRFVTALRREGAVTRAGEESALCRFFTGLFTLPVTAAKWLYAKGKALLDGSLVFSGVTRLGRAGWLLLGVFALVMLVAPHDGWDNLYAFLGAAVIFGLFVMGCSNSEKTLEVKRLGPYFLLYAALILLAFVTSMDLSQSLRFFLFHLTCFFITLVAVSAISSRKQLQTLLVCAAIGLTVASIYGCYQRYMGVEVVASQQDLMLNQGMPGRVYSFFDNPNNFAEVLAMFLPLTWALTLNAKTWRGKLLGVLSLAVSLVAMGMTYSRSSWLGLALAAVVFLALVNPKCLPVLLVVGLCAVPFLPETIWNRILTIGNMKDSSARYRLAIWEDTARLLKDHGLTGVGLGSDVMKDVFKNYPTLYDGHYPIHTHNNYLQMWGETGFFGLLAYLGLVCGRLKTGLQTLKNTDKELKRLLAAAIGGLTGILFIGLVEYTWFYPRNMFLFWLLFAVLASAVKLAKQEPAQH